MVWDEGRKGRSQDVPRRGRGTCTGAGPRMYLKGDEVHVQGQVQGCTSGCMQPIPFQVSPMLPPLFPPCCLPVASLLPLCCPPVAPATSLHQCPPSPVPGWGPVSRGHAAPRCFCRCPCQEGAF